MSTSTVPAAGLGRLAAVLDGSLARRGDPDWDAARQAWHLAVDRRPTAVVRAGSVPDVVAVVDAARALGLRVAPQGTGHNAGALGPPDDTILLRTSALREVRIDPRRRVGRCRIGSNQ